MFGEGFVINPPSHFTVFGQPLYLYGIIIAIGFVLAVLYCYRRCEQFGVKRDSLLDMLFAAVPSAIVCARLYYCVFEWDYYFSHPLEIINIRSGGLAIYGGVIGAVIGAAIFCRIKKIPFGAMVDAGSFGLLIGQAVGRWGNFTNRECFGGETSIFCRMGLTDPISGQTVYVHPAFLYESLWNIIGLALLHIFSKRVKRRFDGQLFVLYIGWYGIGRFFIEGMRTDSLYLWNTNLRISQLVAGACVIAAAALLIYNYVRKNDRKPLWADSESNPLNAVRSEEKTGQNIQEAE
jgi:phosphatidylglycerol:prolipoprotein diacylglycerol transferase